jgi:hypothetical protein
MEIVFSVIVVQVDIGEAIARAMKRLSRIFVGHLGVANVEEQIEIGVVNRLDEIKRRLNRGKGGSRKMFNADLDTVLLSQLGQFGVSVSIARKVFGRRTGYHVSAVSA